MSSPWEFDPYRIMLARKRAGLKRDDLAAEIGKSVDSVIHYEQGATPLTIPTMLKICAALDITPNDLFVPPKPVAPTVTVGQRLRAVRDVDHRSA